MSHLAFIGIGTNLGDRPANYREALERIGQIPHTRILRQSSIYETEPVGEVKGSFLNGAVEVVTELNAQELMRKLLTIERVMGRKRVKGRKPRARRKDRPRTIDLDLLLFDREIINASSLIVPHPRLHLRRFVLAPLSELAPAFIHPRLNLSISDLLARLKSQERVVLMRADLLRAPQPPRSASAHRY